MPLAAILDAPSKIAAAIEKASQATGADFDYLLKTAARESNFRTGAQAPTSSAAGLFQFIEESWLRMVKDQGHRFGVGHLADAIVEGKDGRCSVSDPQVRQEILKLRHDPTLSAMMAGAFTQRNAEYLTARLERPPTEGELYIAHFLGAPRGAHLIKMAEAQPDLRADQQFAREAKANRAIFYAGGKPRTLAQVYETLVSKHCGTPLDEAMQKSKTPPANPQPAPLVKNMDRSTPESPTPKMSTALRAKTLQIRAESMSDASIGSIGQWQTIVLPGPSGKASSRGADETMRGSREERTSSGSRRNADNQPVSLPQRAPERPGANGEPVPAARADASLAWGVGKDFWWRLGGA